MKIQPYKPRPGSHLVMALPDIHFPRHDRHALACVLGVIRLMCPTGLIQLGDAMDCESASSYPKRHLDEGKAERFYESQILPMRGLLAYGELYCDWWKILEGNHEFRVEAKLASLGDFGADIADLVSPRKLLAQGRAKPFTYVPYVQKPSAPLPHVKIADDLVAVHGWSYCKHVAAKHLEIARNCSILFGHVHRRQSHTVRQPIDNKILEAFTPGCLAQLQPLYMAHTPTDAVHGFELIWVTNDGKRWTHYSVVIKDGVCVLPDGRKVDGRDYMKTLEKVEGGM